MIINYLSDYLLSTIISHDHFTKKTGLTRDAIILKCGIKQRRHTQSGEKTDSMTIENKIRNNLSFSTQRINLFFRAAYISFDTIRILPHAIRKQFILYSSKCFTIGSACFSFINVMVTADYYFTHNKESKALVNVSKNNGGYYYPSDPSPYFLWDDSAKVMITTDPCYLKNDLVVLNLYINNGLGHIRKSINSAYLNPYCCWSGILYGNGVFLYVCECMADEPEQIPDKNNASIDHIYYFITHPADIGIIKYIVTKLKLNFPSVLVNIDELGNTDSTNISISVSAFEGEYFCGTILFEKALNMNCKNLI